MEVGNIRIYRYLIPSVDAWRPRKRPTENNPTHADTVPSKPNKLESANSEHLSKCETTVVNEVGVHRNMLTAIRNMRCHYGSPVALAKEPGGGKHTSSLVSDESSTSGGK